jgi:hypothetical protein
MNSQTRIKLRQFCGYLRVDYDLAREFADYGLYPVVYSDDEIEIETRNLYKLKKVVSLHQALGINKEGIEVILSLGERICELQKEIELLRSETAQLKVHADREEPETLKHLGLLIEISDPFTIPEGPPR